MQHLIELKLNTVAFPCLYTMNKHYPREEAAHVALRTIRRFLEKFGERISKVVLVITAPSIRWLQLMPTFLGTLGAAHSMHLMPKGTFDDWGERLYQEKIRISATTTADALRSGEMDISTPVIFSAEETADTDFMSMAAEVETLTRHAWRNCAARGRPWGKKRWTMTNTRKIC